MTPRSLLVLATAAAVNAQATIRRNLWTSPGCVGALTTTTDFTAGICYPITGTFSETYSCLQGGAFIANNMYTYFGNCTGDFVISSYGNGACTSSSGVSWSYVCTPESPSSTSSASGTRSSTRTATGSSTGSSTGSQSPPATGSASQTDAPTQSGTASKSASGSPPVSRSRTAPSTASVSRSSTQSPSPSPTVPVCRAPVSHVRVLNGRSGSVAPATTAAMGNAGLFTSGSCTFGFRTFFNGPRLVFMLLLGEDAPLGGSLTVTTCDRTANNTLLYVGTGCPTWAASFACIRGNDNAGDPDSGVRACASNPRASALVVSPVGSRVYFVQVASTGGEGFSSGLAWAYSPPSASRTPTRRPTPPAMSPSPSTTRQRSATPTRSRTRKPK